jgi:hypothetical protein
VTGQPAAPLDSTTITRYASLTAPYQPTLKIKPPALRGLFSNFLFQNRPAQAKKRANHREIQPKSHFKSYTEPASKLH